MNWGELYPIVCDQAYYAVMRYDPRRKDKVQELVCQSYEKYQNDRSEGKEIKQQDYKCFITQRAKEVDLRSFVKKGFGGTSTTDPLSFYRRRPNSGTEIVEFDEWMTSNPRTKQFVEDSLSFHVDFEAWTTKLNKHQKRVLNYLMQGYKGTQIAKKIKTPYDSVKTIIQQLQELFLQFFEISIYLPDGR